MRGERRSRAGGVVPVALAGAGVLALTGAAALPWLTQDLDDPLSGPVHVAVSGAQRVDVLLPLLFVMLAGSGAAAATRRGWRRAVAAVVTVASVLLGVAATTALTKPAEALVRAQLMRPAEALGPVHTGVAGPVLAFAGAIAVTAAGLWWLLGRSPDRSRSVRYASPGARRAAARTAAKGAASADVSDAASAEDLWQALDAGIDPTAPPVGGAGGDGDDAWSGPVRGPVTMGRPEGGGGGSPIR